MAGNGRAIKGLSRINNMDEFFSHLVDAGGGMDHEVVFTQEGLIRINLNFIPMHFPKCHVPISP